MTIKKHNYLFLIWLLLPLAMFGQQISYQKKIIGRVLAEDTNQPLPFARLSVGGNEIGTLCNEEGLFVLKVPMRLQKDSLRAIYLGYKPTVIPLQELGEDTLTIRLKNQDLTLEAVEILSISPKDTMKRAWRLRGKNYETKSTLLQGFYREEMEDLGLRSKFLFAEGVLELYKSPYHRSSNDRVRVLKGRQKKLSTGYQYEGELYVLPQITQGPHLGLLLDVMKANSSFVRGNNQRLYEYTFEKVDYLNDQLTYIFSFAPKDPEQILAIYEGKIYLDLETLAVVKASYKFTLAGVNLYNRSSKDLKLISRVFEVNYMEYQDKWYLQDARVVNKYRFAPLNRRLYATHTFLTTEIMNDQVNNFPKNNTLGLNEAFVESVETLDEKFWEEYNVVPVKKN